MSQHDDKFAEIISKHSTTFEALARQEKIDNLVYAGSLNDQERDAFYHLLNNREEIKREIDAAHNTAYQLLPAHIIDIYVENYKEHALKIIRGHLAQYNLSPEQLAGIIVEKYINNILGKDFLCPPK